MQSQQFFLLLLKRPLSSFLWLSEIISKMSLSAQLNQSVKLVAGQLQLISEGERLGVQEGLLYKRSTGL